MGRIPSYADGVDFDRMNGGAALAACEKAVLDYPRELRFRALQGRALDRLGRFSEALSAYRIAADRGFAPAQTGLGYLYQNGQGVGQSDAEAVRLYRLAADQGYAMAQDNL